MSCCQDEYGNGGCGDDCCNIDCSARARSSIFSLAAGLVFGIAWFLLIDAASLSSYLREKGKDQVCGHGGDLLLFVRAVEKASRPPVFCLSRATWFLLPANSIGLSFLASSGFQLCLCATSDWHYHCLFLY